MEETHYLLFTFYHVICQTKKLESSASLETVIGYSWLPLLEQGCLKDRDLNLLVSVEKPSPALAMIKPDIKSISEKEQSMHFSVDCVSYSCYLSEQQYKLFSVNMTRYRSFNHELILT
ncbi:unnamed protein product [Schistosoma mattheei]|uniref:C2 DOCK-type domain-containing protein n=1 Tax=Schistosoma mattheei TaxID=31246 RepID=A0A3P8KT34_9TREM|nr:unnamed protein product [Schistosoma mattheei]